ncbi:Zinc finger RNA-binding protein 2 [Taenia solium]|eukprot:TsM_000059800 transcript=TsM_000059800 gene=TsM_000059800
MLKYSCRAYATIRSTLFIVMTKTILDSYLFKPLQKDYFGNVVPKKYDWVDGVWNWKRPAISIPFNPSSKERTISFLSPYFVFCLSFQLMTLAIDSVSNALRRILRARGDDADVSNSHSDADNMDASEPTGVFIVGPAAVGLLLGGQRTADMVLVSHELPSTDCVAEVAEELEELLKESCKNHAVTVATVEGTYVLVQMTSKSTSSADNPTATDIMATVRLRLTSTRILDTKAETALKQPKSGANDHYHEGRTTAAAAAAAAFATSGSGSGSGSGGTHDDDDEHSQFSKALLCVSPRVCRDALTDMRRALWLQGAMAAHPAKTVLQNVARLMRCLIRDSQPLSWGHFSDYVLMVLLERLSYMDLAPPDAYQGAPPRLRMGLLFRRLLECLSTGALISRDGELANLPDPAGTNGALILDDMKQADRLVVTSTAQMALRLVAFRQIYKVICSYDDRNSNYNRYKVAILE